MSEDIDMDDSEISDGPIKNDADVSIYQQTFVTENKNVKALNDEVNTMEQDQLDKEGIDEENVMSQSNGGSFNGPSKPRQHHLDHILVSHQQKLREERISHPHKIMSQVASHVDKEQEENEKMERNAANNTKKWARASSEAPSKSDKINIGEIEVSMSLSQKNDMLHAVAQKATQEELDARMQK